MEPTNINGSHAVSLVKNTHSGCGACSFKSLGSFFQASSQEHSTKVQLKILVRGSIMVQAMTPRFFAVPLLWLYYLLERLLTTVKLEYICVSIIAWVWLNYLFSGIVYYPQLREWDIVISMRYDLVWMNGISAHHGICKLRIHCIPLLHWNDSNDESYLPTVTHSNQIDIPHYIHKNHFNCGRLMKVIAF